MTDLEGGREGLSDTERSLMSEGEDMMCGWVFGSAE